MSAGQLGLHNETLSQKKKRRNWVWGGRKGGNEELLLGEYKVSDRQEECAFKCIAQQGIDDQ
jgi:hypothetical protein